MARVSHKRWDNSRNICCEGIFDFVSRNLLIRRVGHYDSCTGHYDSCHGNQGKAMAVLGSVEDCMVPGELYGGAFTDTPFSHFYLNLQISSELKCTPFLFFFIGACKIFSELKMFATYKGH